MCVECWISEGRPSDLPEGAEQVVRLIGELYDRPDADIGGPLNALLEDFSLVCIEPNFDLQHFTAHTRQLADRISERMRAMTEPQRGAVIALHHGWLPAARYAPTN